MKSGELLRLILSSGKNVYGLRDANPQALRKRLYKAARRRGWESGLVPQEFLLDQNYPNPFNPSTTFRFAIPENSHVTLKVFDILGRELASALGVFEGDKVTLITPQASVTPIGVLPRLRRFTVVGVFEVGMHQFDRSLALVHMSDAQTLFSTQDKVDGIRLKLDNMVTAREVANEIEQTLGEDYWVQDWTDLKSNLFKALQTEKVVMFIILLLIVAVAAFNIISTLVVRQRHAGVIWFDFDALSAGPRSQIDYI